MQIIEIKPKEAHNTLINNGPMYLSESEFNMSIKLLGQYGIAVTDNTKKALKFTNKDKIKLNQYFTKVKKWAEPTIYKPYIINI